MSPEIIYWLLDLSIRDDPVSYQIPIKKQNIQAIYNFVIPIHNLKVTIHN